MRDKLVRSRQEVEQYFAGSAEWRHFSPAILRQYQAVSQLVRKYAYGWVIDLGCGFTPYRHLIHNALVYHTLDARPRREVDFVADIQRMTVVPSECYDTALCFEVLEHVPDTQEALREIHRVLKPGGRLIFSVPFLSRLHELPHDYYRFTANGIAYLLEGTGFTLEEIVVRGGLIAFLGHQLSTTVVSFWWSIPLLRSVAWSANKWLITKPWSIIDRWLGFSDLFPLGYVGVAQRV